MGIKDFINEHYKHFNAGELARCSASLNNFLSDGGRLIVTLAGAMSTAGIGKKPWSLQLGNKKFTLCVVLEPNLEEDLFSLVSRSDYENITNWRQQTGNDDASLAKRGMNRVTDVAIPEKTIIKIGAKIIELWEEAEAVGDSRFPHEYFYDLILHSNLEYSSSPEESWLVAAADANLPIFTPGWEDSTIGNLLSAKVLDCTLKSNSVVRGP